MSDNLHASCVVVGEAGILLRGPSGSGKSTLARRIVEEAQRRGLFARLVGDDRINLSVQDGRLVAKGHAALAGLIEARGIGILHNACEAAAVVRLVVEVGSARLDRMPAREELSAELAGVSVPTMAAEPGDADRVLLRLDASLIHCDGNASCTHTL
jgi:HPr kinase/phosphorylase